MLPIFSVCASLLNLLLFLNFLLPGKVISKLNLAVKHWLVCTTFSVMILSHLRIHSSKNYSLIFLPVFNLILSITLLMNTPRMMNQSILLTHQFLHFIPAIQLIFLKYFNVFPIFLCNSKTCTTKTRTRRYEKAVGRERPTTCTCPWQVTRLPRSLLTQLIF